MNTPPDEPRTAGFWIRMFASLFDIFLIFAFVYGPLMSIFGRELGLLQWAVDAALVAFTVFMWQTRGGTPGKLLLGLRVAVGEGLGEREALGEGVLSALPLPRALAEAVAPCRRLPVTLSVTEAVDVGVAEADWLPATLPPHLCAGCKNCIHDAVHPRLQRLRADRE